MQVRLNESVTLEQLIGVLPVNFQAKQDWLAFVDNMEKISLGISILKDKLDECQPKGRIITLGSS